MNILTYNYQIAKHLYLVFNIGNVAAIVAKNINNILLERNGILFPSSQRKKKFYFHIVQVDTVNFKCK